MSRFEECPSQHDYFVSLAITYAQGLDSDFELMAADGGLPYLSHVAPCPAPVQSYRPDAFLSTGTRHLVVEVKSIEDVTSAHSRRQFQKLLLLLQDPSWSLLLLVFGTGYINLQSNPEFSALKRMNRVYFVPVRERISSHESV